MTGTLVEGPLLDAGSTSVAGSFADISGALGRRWASWRVCQRRKPAGADLTNWPCRIGTRGLVRLHEPAVDHRMSSRQVKRNAVGSALQAISHPGKPKRMLILSLRHPRLLPIANAPDTVHDGCSIQGFGRNPPAGGGDHPERLSKSRLALCGRTHDADGYPTREYSATAGRAPPRGHLFQASWRPR
jgi:hypothetical protein